MNKHRNLLLATLAAVMVTGAAVVVVINLQSKPSKTFAGTDVPRGEKLTGSGSSYCEPYSSNLKGLTELSTAVVLATVSSEDPVFEPVYGVAAPRRVDGELPARRSDNLNRELTLDIERVLSGKVPTGLRLSDPGWIYSDDQWQPTLRDTAFVRLQPGDKAVIPIVAYPEKGGPQFGIACTGAFVVRDGRIADKPGSTDFRAEGVYGMSTEAFAAALRAAG